jgi:hypothetical protein
MAISPLWPKPPRWPIHPGTVDPNQRWVWHTRPRFILPLWEHASGGAAQRYIRLAQTRRTARTWQLNTGAAAMRTRYGPGVSIPTTHGVEIEALAGSNPSFAAWEQDEPYTIALLIKGRSGGASTKHLYRSGTSSTSDHILVPYVGHHAQPASPGEWWRDRLDHVVRRARERYDLVDESSGHGDQDASSCTWTAGRVPRARRRRPTAAPCSASTAGAGASRPRRTSMATSR